MILTRKPGETIHLTENITLRVLEVHGTVVRVGVFGPSVEADSLSELHAENEVVKPVECEDWLEKVRRSQAC